MKHRKIELTARDIEIFLFLWKWKVASTTLLWSRFFSKVKPKRCQQRLSDLLHDGYIERLNANSATFWVWSLSKKGFECMRSNLPFLKEEGFKSESPVHDLYVVATQLGNWATTDEPDDVTIVTEQQLRRYEVSEFPSSLPRYFMRRPDGYWILDRGEKVVTIALEVELSRKSEREYIDIAHAYSNENVIDWVIWVVPAFATAARYAAILNGTQYSKRPIHNFILLPDVEQIGWQAEVKIGALKSKSLASILISQAREVTGNRPRQFPAQLIMDARRSPFSSDGCFKPMSKTL